MTELSELTHIVTKTCKWYKSHMIVFVYLLCTIALRQTCNLSKLAIYSRRSGKVVQGGEPQTVQIVRQGEPTL
ncbi:hypothetical protein [Avibacterium endocarditidis]|uniref:hypothetical protein n=1 Tax=Avibacterium TaxID=292486 RepID=UPI0039FBF605